MHLIRLLALVLFGLAAACTQIESTRSVEAKGAATPPSGQQPALTVLISIDGFRADYLDRGDTPTLKALAETGARSAMRPSFPSVTFPNHYALITGRRPDRNGIVNNRMEDPRRPGVVFTIGDRKIASDPFWWSEATPLWVTAEKMGVRSGVMFWPGSDYEISGVRPTHWRSFDQSLPDFARVDAVLSWLDESSTKPRFLALYFDEVDSAGHKFGPDAPETRSATAQADAAIGRLIAGLKGRGVSANIVVVADHGMARVDDGQQIDLDPATGGGRARVFWDGPNAGVNPLPGHEAEVQSALLGRSPHGECWRKGEAPARFHYGANARVPAIVCLADLHWRYRSSQFPPYAGQTLGAHGFDPAEKDMSALFVANGPAFKRGVTLASFDNVSVYPLLARLIGVAPEDNDGNLADIAPAFR